MTLKALLVGINYTTKSYLRLSGCVNDVLAAKDYLVEKHAAKPENIKVMVDDSSYYANNGNHQPALWPTKTNFLKSLAAFLKSSQAGDVLLFHYSGHGTQVRDSDGSSHEALVPLDVKDVGNKFENIIHDHELEKIILDNTPAKVTLYVILDCCYGGGDIEKQGIHIRKVLLPHKALGSQIRVALPRGATSSTLVPDNTPSRSMVSMLRDVTEKRKGEITIVGFAGGSKFEPVADATFNYRSFGAFSYFLYNTLQLNKPLQNIKVIDTVKDSIKRSNFSQSPQLVASNPEQSKWGFLTNKEGDANATVVMLRDLVAITGASDIRGLNDKEVEELHLMDAAASLEVHQEVTWHERERAIRVPFVAQDISRVIAAVAGRAVLKIAQSQGLEENIAFSAASLAIRETTHRIFEQLLLAPINGKRTTVKQPDLFNLMENIVTPAIDKVLKEYLPDVKKEFVERATANSTAVSLPNISAALAQPVDLSMQLADLCSQIIPKSANHLPATNKLVARSIELAKQVVSAIIACDIYRQDINKKLPNVTEMAKEIANKVESKFNDSFISQLASSVIPQVEVEKVAVGVVRDIAKDRVIIVDQDFEDRVVEVTNRFSNFICIIAPIGQTLLSTLTSHTTPIALVESFVSSMSKIAVDDVIAGLTTTNGYSKLYSSTTKVPILFKVAAKSVAEVAAHSVLDVLKYGNNNLNTGTLAGIVNVVTKSSAMKVLELLANVTNVKMNGIDKRKNIFNMFYALAHIAVQASTSTMNSLSLDSRAFGEIDFATQQALSNRVSISATRFFSFLPILGSAIPLVQTALTGCQNLSSRNSETINFGTEILATTMASLSQHGPISQSVAEEIVRDAVAYLASDKTDTDSIIDSIVFSIQRALEQRSNLKDAYNTKTLRREVIHFAKHFEAFYPDAIFATSLSTSLAIIPGLNMRAVIDGSAAASVQQLRSFIPEGFTKMQGDRALPSFILNVGRTTAIVAANTLLGVLQNRGALTPTFAKFNELQDRIKRLAVNVSKKIISDLLTSQTSATVLEIVAEVIVMEVAKEADAIIGTTTTITTSLEAAQVIAERARCFGALLPILASVTPSLIQSVVVFLSNHAANRGVGDSSDINVQVIVLATVDIIFENYGMLKSKSGNLITIENAMEVVNQAIQNSRENQTTVEQAIRKAFQISGIGGEFNEFNIRSVIIRATRIMNENPETAPRSTFEDVELEMIEPIASVLMQQRTFGSYLPLVVQAIGKTVCIISGKASLSICRNLLQSRAITSEVANSFVLSSMQNATMAAINLLSQGPHDGLSFEQMILNISQSSVDKALEQQIATHRGSIDVMREVHSVYGASDFSRKIGLLGGFEIGSRAMKSTQLRSDFDDLSKTVSPTVRAATHLATEASYLIISSLIKADEVKSQNVFKEVFSSLLTELSNNEFITRLYSTSRPLDNLDQVLIAQLTQALNRNSVSVPNDLANQVRLVLSEFNALSPVPCPVASKSPNATYDALSPMVSALATGVVQELSQSAIFSASQRSTERSYSHSPFALILAKSVAELSAHAVLEVICKMNVNNSSFIVSSVLSSVAKKSAQQVFDLVLSSASRGQNVQSGWLVTTILPSIVDIVVQGVRDLLSASSINQQNTRDVRAIVLEAVTSSSRFLNPLMLGANSQLFSVMKNASQSLSGDNEITSVGSDAAASIAFIIANQEGYNMGSAAEKLASEAAAMFQRNSTRIAKGDWSAKRLEDEVYNAIIQAVTSSGSTRKRTENEMRSIVCSSIPQFIPFLPPSIPVCGTQHSKEEILAKVDQQVNSVVSVNNTGSEFINSIARGAAKVSAGTVVDTVASLNSGAASDLILKAALDVGVKTATIVVSSFSNQASRSVDNVVLSDILSTCRPIIHEGVMMASRQSNVREYEIQSVTSTHLANNTRFFGPLLPILSSVAPTLVQTISNTLSGRSASGISYKAYEAAAITTATLMLESRGTQDTNFSTIESAIRNCVDRLSAGQAQSGRTGDISLEEVMRIVEQVLQGNKNQMVPKNEIEGRLRSIGNCMSISNWSKMNTSWTKFGATDTSRAIGPQVEYSDQVLKMASQVLQIYNGSTFYREELSKAAVCQSIEAVLTFPRLHGFPETFVCEVAKTAGNITAKEMLHQHPDSHRAVTLGLAVVAQLLTPNDLPRGLCVGERPQAR